MRDLHRLLGVRPGADVAELRRAYRCLVQLFHPDKYRGTPGEAVAAERLREITAAYEELRRYSHRARPTVRPNPPDDVLRFALQGEEFACTIRLVQEVLPWIPLQSLPGMVPPLAGFRHYREELLPVLAIGDGPFHCVLVLVHGGKSLGFALESLPVLTKGVSPGEGVELLDVARMAAKMGWSA